MTASKGHRRLSSIMVSRHLPTASLPLTSISSRNRWKTHLATPAWKTSSALQ